MKKVMLVIIVIVFFSCKKDKINYTLNFEASHNVSEENQFAEPSAYYSWSIEDENDKETFSKSGTIKYETVKGTATAQTGDWIYIYISVNDAFDIGSVSCESTDGSIFLYAHTDNMYINESDNVTAKRINIDGIDTVVNVKQMKVQLK